MISQTSTCTFSPSSTSSSNDGKQASARKTLKEALAAEPLNMISLFAPPQDENIIQLLKEWSLADCGVEQKKALASSLESHLDACALHTSDHQTDNFVATVKELHERVKADLAADYLKSKSEKHGKESAELSPYYYRNPDKYSYENLNGSIKEGEGNSFVCRHFAASLQAIGSHAETKERIKQFGQEGTARKLFHEAGYSALQAKSHDHSPNVPCQPDRFGKICLKLSETLKENDSSNYTIATRCDRTKGGHALTLSLSKKNGKLYIGLYDPNVTGNIKHLKADLEFNNEAVGQLNIKSFIASPDWADAYFAVPTFAILDVTEEFARENTLEFISGQNMIDSVGTALCEGNEHHIERVLAKLLENDRHEDFKIGLQGGIPALKYSLRIAMQEGHADAIKAFGEVLAKMPVRLSNTDLADLLSAEIKTGSPGLLMAMKYGDASTIKAFGEILEKMKDQLSSADLVGLLAARDQNGVPAIDEALKNGHAGSVKAFGDILVKMKDKLFGAALSQGNSEAVRAFGEVLLNVAGEMSDDTLLALLKGSNYGKGLADAMGNGKHLAVGAFGDVLVKIAYRISTKNLIELLAPVDDSGISLSGLYPALREGHHDAIKAFGALLIKMKDKIPGADLVRLLAARDKAGVSGLRRAILAGNDRAMAELMTLIRSLASSLGKAEKAQLLNELRLSHGSPGFLWIWANNARYNDLKKRNPDLHREFKAVKALLK